MNKIFGVVIMVVLMATFGFGQIEYMKLKPEKWVLVTTEATHNQPVYVDTVNMWRRGVVVGFFIRHERRGINVYTLTAGDCVADLFMELEFYTADVGETRTEKRVKLEGVESSVSKVEPDTVGYAILNYVCKNAKKI